jgi:bifunctional non-homologous end joining protein LigD
MAQQDFEGIVGKRLDAPYKAGRQPFWVKVKNPSYSRQDAIIGFRRSVRHRPAH